MLWQLIKNKILKKHVKVNSLSLDEVYSSDEYKYKIQVKDFLDIQFLENILKENSVDGLINKSENYNDGLSKNIPLNNKVIKINYKELDNFTYIHHGYINNILEMSLEFIKRLLSINKIMRLDDIEEFKNHDYILQFNSSLVDDNYITYLVNKLLYYNNINITFTNSKYDLNKTIF